MEVIMNCCHVQKPVCVCVNVSVCLQEFQIIVLLFKPLSKTGKLHFPLHFKILLIDTFEQNYYLRTQS